MALGATVGDPGGPVQVQMAAAKQAGEGGTYLLKDPKTGEIVRTGRTNDLSRREAEHARDPKLKRYDFKVDKRTDSYAAQRGREQIIHDKHKPPLNKVNPISPSNKRRGAYMKAGRGL
jgi:hypothetical protein